jgi:saccharopine dehydrogenase-like NADP-dependent oxidoreductase
MKKITLLGTGKSSQHLIQNLYRHVESWNIELAIGDLDISGFKKKYNDKPHVTFFEFEKDNFAAIEAQIKDSFMTISMLPATLHIQIARMCLAHESHLITPSYVSDEMKALDSEAKAKNLIFLNEMGFDPGIDHLTTMKIYHELEEKGAQLTSYKSYAGGLVAPKSDTNSWGYKFSWNPRNVILAGQGGTIKYLENNKNRYIPYYALFQNAEQVSISNGLHFDGYANRDSLKYKEVYQWNQIETLYRGTLRRPHFCNAWNILVMLGLTDDSFELHLQESTTFADFYNQFYDKKTIKNQFSAIWNADIEKKLDFIGFNDSKSILKKTTGSPAAILQSILEEKWALSAEDTDFVVMVHYFEFIQNNKKYQIESYMTLEGEDATYTAMSKTVGMPIFFAAEMILNQKIAEKGILLPLKKEIYVPILKKLEVIGVIFHEKIIELG